MATVVFDNDGGGGDNLWSTNTNWVGNALPLAADTADIDAACTVDVSDIIAQLDVASSLTLTLNANIALTGMTEDTLGAGAIYMNAGSSLIWDTGVANRTCSLDITSRGTFDNWCTIQMISAFRRLTLNGINMDFEYTDILKIGVIGRSSTGEYMRLYYVNAEGDAIATGAIIPYGETTIIDHVWLSDGSGFNLTSRVGGDACFASHLTLGEDRHGASKPNVNDLSTGISTEGGNFHGKCCRLTSSNQFFWANKTRAGNNYKIDDFGCANGVGDPGGSVTDTPFWNIERNSAAAKSGSYGARITPKLNADRGASENAVLSLFVPIASGDDLDVEHCFIRPNAGTSLDDSKVTVTIDPTESWFDGANSASPTWSGTDWQDVTPTAVTGARGTNQVGACEVEIRLADYSAADYIDATDVEITCGGITYTFGMDTWRDGMPSPDE
jgi:hypothetical protein